MSKESSNEAEYREQPRSGVGFKLDRYFKFDRQYYYLFLGYGIVGLLLIAIQLQKVIPVRYLTRDPLAIVGKPFYFGALSNIGILLWCASVSTCLFSFLLLKLTKLDEKFARFFLASGLLSALFMIDDLFMLHEEVFPKLFDIKETFVYLIYAVLFALYLLKFRKFLLSSKPLIFGFILLFLGISITADMFLAPYVSSSMELLIEDGFKLIAIFTWFIYFSGIAFDRVRHHFWSASA